MTSAIISVQQQNFLLMILLFFLFWNGANLSEFHLNSDLKTSEWAYQWKMSFNPDISKQAQEVIFSIKAFHLAVFFNIIPVARYVLGWEAKLWLLYNKSQKIAKANKVFDDVKRLHNVLSCKLLVIFNNLFPKILSIHIFCVRTKKEIILLADNF